MKVYLFYIIDKKMISYLKDLGLCDWLRYQEDEVQEGMLYGYTKSKKVAKEFWKSRDHSIFLKKEVEVGKSDFLELENRSYTFGRIAEEEITFLMDGLKKMVFPLTSAEIWNVIEERKETINYYIDGYIEKIDTRIFNKELRDALRDLGYNDYVTNEDGIPEDQVLSKVARYTLYDAWKSEFGLFSFLYGDMINYTFVLERMSEFEEKET